MFSLICNSLKLIHGAFRRRGWAFFMIGLALATITSSGCRQDSAQWKLAAANNEEADGNPEAAIELLQDALRMDPESDDIKLRLALLLAKNDQGDLSRTLCDEVLENDPKNKRAWGVLSQCLHSMGCFDESLAAYQEYVADKIHKAPHELNQLAYFRALAGVQLDKALRQIDKGILEYEQQFGSASPQEFNLFAPPSPSWGSYSGVPIEINAVVSAGLLSRYTDDGHQHVIGLLSDMIQEEGQLWVAEERKESQGEDVAKQENRYTGNLKVLLAARSLMLDDQGQTEFADRDRLWLKQIGEQPQEVYDTLPNVMECLAALATIEATLDTRGYILTQLPWQPTWTHPSGKLMKLEDRVSDISYGNYELAIRDLDLAIAAAQVRLLALNSDAVNRIEYSIESVRSDKVNGAKSLAILLDHRRQAHLKANQIEAAQRDQERVEELGFDSEDGLF